MSLTLPKNGTKSDYGTTLSKLTVKISNTKRMKKKTTLLLLIQLQFRKVYIPQQVVCMQNTSLSNPTLLQLNPTKER